jgi:hypothetical protein
VTQAHQHHQEFGGEDRQLEMPRGLIPRFAVGRQPQSLALQVAAGQGSMQARGDDSTAQTGSSGGEVSQGAVCRCCSSAAPLTKACPVDSAWPELSAGHSAQSGIHRRRHDSGFGEGGGRVSGGVEGRLGCEGVDRIGSRNTRRALNDMPRSARRRSRPRPARL